jgi:hypothetical protein
MGLEKLSVLKEFEAPRIFRQSAVEGGSFFSPMHQPPLPPRDFYVEYLYHKL